MYIVYWSGSVVRTTLSTTYEFSLLLKTNNFENRDTIVDNDDIFISDLF